MRSKWFTGKQLTEDISQLRFSPELFGLSRCQVLNAPLEDILVFRSYSSKLHNERAVRGQCPEIWVGLSVVLCHMEIQYVRLNERKQFKPAGL
jgi:hypothetical protein